MKNLLEIEIGDVWVEGEISNLRRQASGHCYFTLKDEGAQISCVLFRGNAARAKAQPGNGMQARLFGEVSVYEARGQMQLLVKQVEDAGQGDLQARFEALKRKLDAEGLFDPTIKKKLPPFPRVIGLVTSPTGAALQDMLNILKRRAPWVQPVLYPVTVQGKGAERTIAKAIRELGEPEKYDLPQVDVIITGRGGGSLEDLWNFNEEVVARAIYTCPIPVVSAVGHEIDFTISDFAADVRAPTPSAAIELVVPDSLELKNTLASRANRIKQFVRQRVASDQAFIKSARRILMPRDSEMALREPVQRLDQMQTALQQVAYNHIDDIRRNVSELSKVHAAHHPKKVLQRREELLAQTGSRLSLSVRNQLTILKEKVSSLKSIIHTLGPESTFARGFSLTTDENGAILTDASEVPVGSELVTRLGKGYLKSKVTDAGIKKKPR